MKIKLILLIEDDPQQAESIRKAILGKYPDAKIDHLETESDFYNYMDRAVLSKIYPQIVVCDVMLPWTHAVRDIPKIPREVEKGTFRKAGLRCWKRFRKKNEFEAIPWIHFTALDEDTIDFRTNKDTWTGFATKFSSTGNLLNEISKRLEPE